MLIQIKHNSRNIIRFIAYRLLPETVVRFIRYPREHFYVQGYLSFSNNKQSVIFFTSHKCASVFMGHILKQINNEYMRLTHLNLAAYFWDVANDGTTSVHSQLQNKHKILFREKGKLYAPIRDYVDITHLKDIKVILMLRDPRDVLVSSYYSAKHSHRPPMKKERRKTFLRERERLNKLSLQEYVLEQAPLLEQRYRNYRENIPHGRLITYEEMWWDFTGFMKRLGHLLGIELEEEFITKLSTRAQIDVTEQEDVMSHRRKGVPGDYKDKLEPDTAETLTEIFFETLMWMYGK